MLAAKRDSHYELLPPGRGLRDWSTTGCGALVLAEHGGGTFLVQLTLRIKLIMPKESEANKGTSLARMRTWVTSRRR